jgi:2-oxoglutarate ferredoxin oxidoreductase subunit alpha
MVEALPPLGGIALQGEDEIASIGYCLGASMAGMKAMTATSGPGISLYSENISFAVGSEIPIVIVNVMRQGPSTGSATRAADGDVQFMRWGQSGGLPVIVLAPTDAPDCFTLTVQAFNLAERFRCPVFLASNKEIGLTRETVHMDFLERPEVLDRVRHDSGSFLPFRVRGGGDVPDFLPIGGGIPVRQTSSTHGQDGYITVDPSTIQTSLERLKRKVESQVDTFTFFDLEQRDHSKTLVITYGATSRVARTACRLLEKRGIPVSLLVLKTLWPVPESLISRAAGQIEGRILVVEMNLGQYVFEIQRILCGRKVDFFGKMCGQLISPDEIVREILNV